MAKTSISNSFQHLLIIIEGFKPILKFRFMNKSNFSNKMPWSTNINAFFFAFGLCDQKIHIFQINLAKIPKIVKCAVIKVYKGPRMSCKQESCIFLVFWMKYWKFRSWKNLKGGTAAVPPGGTATILSPNPVENFRRPPLPRLLHNAAISTDQFRSVLKTFLWSWKEGSKKFQVDCWRFPISTLLLLNFSKKRLNWAYFSRKMDFFQVF